MWEIDCFLFSRSRHMHIHIPFSYISICVITFRYGNYIVEHSWMTHLAFLSLCFPFFGHARRRVYVRWTVKAVPHGYWFTRVGLIVAFPCILPVQISLPNAIFVFEFTGQKTERCPCISSFFRETKYKLSHRLHSLLKADCVLTPGTG